MAHDRLNPRTACSADTTTNNKRHKPRRRHEEERRLRTVAGREARSRYLAWVLAHVPHEQAPPACIRTQRLAAPAEGLKNTCP